MNDIEVLDALIDIERTKIIEASDALTRFKAMRQERIREHNDCRQFSPVPSTLSRTNQRCQRCGYMENEHKL